MNTDENRRDFLVMSDNHEFENYQYRQSTKNDMDYIRRTTLNEENGQNYKGNGGTGEGQYFDIQDQADDIYEMEDEIFEMHKKILQEDGEYFTKEHEI